MLGFFGSFRCHSGTGIMSDRFFFFFFKKKKKKLAAPGLGYSLQESSSLTRD